MKVLVVGGAGYIGSHTCKALAESGHEPLVFDNLSTGHRAFVKWGPLMEGDLADPAALANLFREYEFDAIIHFAALAYVGDSVVDPASYYANNVVGSLNLLNAMRAHGCPPLVFSSSCATYGVPSSVPITEATPQQPINPYGRTKLMIEQVMDDYEQAYGQRGIALRYFNAAGCDPEGEIGEMHDPEPHLIPRILMAASGELPTVQINGTDYPTPDGTCIRDYIHVTDLAAAHVSAVQRLTDGYGSGRYNLGTGTGYSVKDIVESVGRVTGRNFAVETGPRRPGDPAELVADAGLAKRVLGFEPRHSDLDTIIETAWHWHQRLAR